MRTRVNQRPLTIVLVQVPAVPAGDGTPVMKPVDAEVIGQWAVHKSIGKTRGYSITYVRENDDRNGLCLGPVEDAEVDRITAVRLAEVLDGKLGRAPLDLERHKAIIVAEIRKICGVEAA